MESNPICKEHNKPIQMYCKDCSDFVCIRCFPIHEEKGCKYPIDLITYGKEALLVSEAYLTKINSEDQIMEKLIKRLIGTSEIVKQELVKLRTKLIELLESADESLDLIEESEDSFEPMVELLKNNIKSRYEKLKRATENEDLKCIVEQAEECEGNDKIEKLASLLNRNVRKCINSNFLDKLTELLKRLNVKYGQILPNNYLMKRHKFIYGTCTQEESNTVLCKFDIATKRFGATVNVPQYCVVIQIKERIFTTGGYDPYTNKVYEFIETTQSLFPKQPMKYAKNCHAACAISTNSFVTIGGFNKAALSCCEEYLLSADTWMPFPSLNVARLNAGSILMKNRYLYAVGGRNTKNEIEVIDISIQKSWMLVNIASNELDFNECPEILRMSDNKLIILCGNDTTEAGIFNIKHKTIKKHPLCTVADYFACNSATVIGRKTYLMGYQGNVYIYDLITKNLKEFPYSNMF
eukprot:TRINITY_DN9427_c0_g1_i13.p1 TRINITY_DN9427_c0_g1~~TRINITY_DN9427_c0_g1_i13.p1  ORF type:complete len:466 (+),score=31.16 TRINITY_DN9427_c0_g1_i13:172-1569(+)